MLLLRQLSRSRDGVCQQCLRRGHTLAHRAQPKTKKTEGSEKKAARKAAWEKQADRIRTGAQQSVLSLLEERGLVKDIAGGRQNLDRLLTEKPIGAYVGVDPTAPSLHVGHLLPLMVLFWLHIYGYSSISLLGAGTVDIGDPSGRTTARSRMSDNVRTMNANSVHMLLQKLRQNVKALRIKHQYLYLPKCKAEILSNRHWLANLTALKFMRDLGSGMRLGSMLARDSVKLRMESGEGMSISEFSYPLFQAYDWWHMYQHYHVQLQIGGSDQYGNICAGMDAISHMRKLRRLKQGFTTELTDDPSTSAYGLTTPLLTTASGEKFGKSAGNAVWLDQDMMSSFDLYQYFVRTADSDVERYLKLLTFIPLDQIRLIMNQQHLDESKRTAQHILAKEVVELVHGAESAKQAQRAHSEAFSHGTSTFSLGALRRALEGAKENVPKDDSQGSSKKRKQLDILAHKRAFVASSPATPQTTPDTSNPVTESIVTLPLSLLTPGSFPRVLHAAGLAASVSDAKRLIKNNGAYVVVPNSGTYENPTTLSWVMIEQTSEADPLHFLVDQEALVLRSGKSNIRICKVVKDEDLPKVEAKAEKK